VGTLSPISAAFRVIEETGKKNAVVCIDPTAFPRAGNTADELAGFDPRLMPYTQLKDGKREGAGRLRPGEGDAALDAFLDAMPTNVPLSLEWPAPKDSSYSADEWAKLAMDGTRRFLDDYYASRTALTRGDQEHA
jgi:hypothetical protein